MLFVFDPPQFMQERAPDKPEIRVEVPLPGEARAAIDLRGRF
jgi:hypothetical protein